MREVTDALLKKAYDKFAQRTSDGAVFPWDECGPEMRRIRRDIAKELVRLLSEPRKFRSVTTAGFTYTATDIPGRLMIQPSSGTVAVLPTEWAADASASRQSANDVLRFLDLIRDFGPYED